MSSFKNPYTLASLLALLVAAAVPVGLLRWLSAPWAILAGLAVSLLVQLPLLALLPHWQVVLALVEKVSRDDGLQSRFRWGMLTENGALLLFTSVADLAKAILAQGGHVFPVWFAMDKMSEDQSAEIAAAKNLLLATRLEEPDGKFLTTDLVGVARLKRSPMEGETGPSFVFTERRGSEARMSSGEPTHHVFLPHEGCQLDSDDEDACKHSHHGLIFPDGAGILGLSREQAQRIANLGPSALGFRSDSVLVALTPIRELVPKRQSFSVP